MAQINALILGSGKPVSVKALSSGAGDAFEYHHSRVHGAHCQNCRNHEMYRSLSDAIHFMPR
eukprot:6393491-Amphidinium_carterae.1